MKVLLVVAAVTLLQLVCAAPHKQLDNRIKMLKEMHRFTNSSAATLPLPLLKTMVPLMESCEKDIFCKVKLVLLDDKFNNTTELYKLRRSLDIYNDKHKNCAMVKLEMSPTSEGDFQDLLLHFITCIRKESIDLK